MAELHVIGQIVGAAGFRGDGLFCKWSFHAGPAWDLVEGHAQGQTHVDRPHDAGCSSFPLGGGGGGGGAPGGAGEPPVVWSHPLDVHYACRGLSVWPRLQVQVWREIDGRGRSEICAYGFVHVPVSPGTHDIDCLTWAPEASAWIDRARAMLRGAAGGGGALRLCDEAAAHLPRDRFRLQTGTRGVVRLRLGVIAKDFARHNVSI